MIIVPIIVPSHPTCRTMMIDFNDSEVTKFYSFHNQRQLPQSVGRLSV